MQPEAWQTTLPLLLIDDDREGLEALAETLELAGFSVSAAASWVEARPFVSAGKAEIVITDIRMPGEDGFVVLAALQALDKEIPVIMVTGHADVPMGVRAMQQGAYDFIEKPIDPTYLLELVRRAVDHRRLVLDHRSLRNAVQSRSVEGRILGDSPAIRRLRDMVTGLAQVDVSVLVHGETGTGKELVARALHDFGPRSGANFVAINCAALPPTLLESELFGHESGAFTGARGRRIGKIEQAHRGTLFLDEIEGMSLEAQARLLRVLQERRVERLGGEKEIDVDVRLVAATKADLVAQAMKGLFREDLVYRLNVVSLEIPPLRARGEADIEMIFRYFFSEAAARLGDKAAPLPPLAPLARHDWPGNVRELRNAAERAALGFPVFAQKPGEAVTPSRETLAARMHRHERRELESALAEGGQLQHIAADLGISRKTLYLKMRDHGLAHPGLGEENE
ncbi:MAG: sigma-54 dependent transcriptional regulator [Proteobacteria bacterium]|nr:sigma-54 dependent transcriptional regulator [Pseudomonadota bacterium]